jgi:hypothetical protein
MTGDTKRHPAVPKAWPLLRKTRSRERKSAVKKKSSIKIRVPLLIACLNHMARLASNPG